MKSKLIMGTCYSANDIHPTKPLSVKPTPAPSPTSSLSVTPKNIASPKSFSFSERRIHDYIEEKKNKLKTLEETLANLKIPCIVTEIKDDYVKVAIALTAYQLPMLRRTYYAFMQVKAKLIREVNVEMLNSAKGQCYIHFVDNALNANLYKDPDCLISFYTSRKDAANPLG